MDNDEVAVRNRFLIDWAMFSPSALKPCSSISPTRSTHTQKSSEIGHVTTTTQYLSARRLPRRRTHPPLDPPDDKTTMFAVSSNALLARPAAVTRGARAPAARRVVAVHASADAPVSTKMAKMATVALLSATVAFAHPGYANAGLFGGGEKVGKYAEDDTARYMREIEEARCVRWINPPAIATFPGTNQPPLNPRSIDPRRVH